MTAHDPTLSGPTPPPGGATVADLRRMDGLGALAVMMFRDSFQGPPGTARLRLVLCDALGQRRGARAFDDWSDLMQLLVHHARRPLVRHDLTCCCVGADEAVIAQILSLFATGAREDAMLTLTLLLPGDRVMPVSQVAERVARALMQVARHYDRLGPPPASPRTLH